MAIFLASAAIGLFIAMLVVPGFSINLGSFVGVVIMFAVLQALLTPFLGQAADRKAPVLASGVGLLTAFIALFLTNLVSSGMTISGFSSWIFATLLIWIVCMLASFILPMIFLKNRIEDRRTPS